MKKIECGIVKDKLEDIVRALRAGLGDNYKDSEEKYFSIVRCDSYDKAKKLLVKLHRLGYTWKSGTSLYDNTKYDGDIVFYCFDNNKKVTRDAIASEREERYISDGEKIRYRSYDDLEI